MEQRLGEDRFPGADVARQEKYAFAGEHGGSQPVQDLLLRGSEPEQIGIRAGLEWPGSLTRPLVPPARFLSVLANGDVQADDFGHQSPNTCLIASINGLPPAGRSVATVGPGALPRYFRTQSY